MTSAILIAEDLSRHRMSYLIELLLARCDPRKPFRNMNLSDDLRALQKVSRGH